MTAVVGRYGVAARLPWWENGGDVLPSFFFFVTLDLS